MAKKKSESLSDIAEILSAGLVKAATRPDITGYVPHAKQKIFHESTKKGKLYIGGNRSGKTVGGVIEDIWWMEGTHPYRETPPPPIRARLVCVDYPNGWVKIIKPVLQQWIRPASLIDGSWEASWSEREKRLTLANGSFLEIMNYEQHLDAFAGSSRHLVHFDEEPPKAIWIENRMRLMDTGGSWHITMTPVEGMTWVYDDIYEPITQGTESKIDLIEVDVEENTYLSPVEIEDALAGLDENEKKARKSGKFVQIGGLIFKKFNADVHVIAPPRGIPPGWRVAGSIDHGYNHPTAVMWHMISPKDVVVTFKEHYRSEFTIQQHVQMIREKEAEIRALGYHDDILYWCDPAMRQRGAVTGNSVQLEYQMRGINAVPSNNEVSTGLARMLGYQNHGRWFITEECPNLLREMRRYRWKTRESRKLQEKHGAYDEPHKKDDDAMDSSRYFFMSLPELKPRPTIVEDIRSRHAEVSRMLQATTPRNLYVPQTDRSLLQPNYNDFKVSTDEFMGGEW
jgi:phage terminase large subunit-like protein